MTTPTMLVLIVYCRTVCIIRDFIRIRTYVHTGTPNEIVLIFAVVLDNRPQFLTRGIYFGFTYSIALCII